MFITVIIFWTNPKEIQILSLAHFLRIQIGHVGILDFIFTSTYSITYSCLHCNMKGESVAIATRASRIWENDDYFRNLCAKLSRVVYFPKETRCNLGWPCIVREAA